MIELAEIINLDGRYQSLMLLTTPQMSQMGLNSEKLGVKSVDVSKQIMNALDKKNNRIFYKIVNAAFPSAEPRLPNALFSAIRFDQELKVWHSQFVSILEKINPVMVMLPGDRELQPVAPMLKACASLSIPTAICVSSLPNIGALRSSRSHKGFSCSNDSAFLNRWAAKMHPKQVNQINNDPMLFSQGWRVWALARNGMLSQNPWVQGGGNADFVFHHNKSRLEQAIEDGLEEDKAVFVGDHTLDPLHNAWLCRDSVRNNLMAEHGISKKQKLAIVSVPNDAEHGLCDMETHLSRLSTWFQKLSATNLATILSFHPKSDICDYRSIVSQNRFHTTQRKLSQILPAADVYICSCSSTIHWAQLCGIPTINMDYIPFRSDHFTAPCGVQTAETPEQFSKALKVFQSNDALTGLMEWAAEVRSQSLFDGKSGKRICEFLNNQFGCRDERS